MDDTLPICRVCLQPSMEYIDFESPLENLEGNNSSENCDDRTIVTFADGFRSLTMLDVSNPTSSNDPQSLCDSCGMELKIAYYFQQRALHAETVLRNQQEISIENFEVIDSNDDQLLEPNEEIINHEFERNTSSSSPASLSEAVPYSAEDDDIEFAEADFLEEDNKDDEVIKEIRESFEEILGDESVLQTAEISSRPKQSGRSKGQVCKVCGHLVTANETLRSHMQSAHGDLVQCADCDFTGRMAKVMQHGWQVHGHGRKFNCKICGKPFSSNSTLNAHMKYHQRKEANFKSDACHICGKQFASQYYLNYHMDVHLDQRDHFQCEHEGCGKMYVSKTALDAHTRLHTGDTIDCTVCGKQFVRQYELNVHMRFHKRDYPFKCEVCGKAYAIKGHLRSHMWTHQGLKLQCEDCGKLFTSAKALQEHSYSHSNQMPYPCSHCEKGYPSRQKYKVHLRRVHQLELDDIEMQKIASNFTRKPMQRKKWTLVQTDTSVREVTVKTKPDEYEEDVEEEFLDLE